MADAPQRLQALAVANSVRRVRAELKRRIAGGELTAAEVILDPPDQASSLTIGELLASQRGWGPARCKTFLSRHQINETKRLSVLTHRQRQLLASQLTPTAGRRQKLTTLRPGTFDKEHHDRGT